MLRTVLCCAALLFVSSGTPAQQQAPAQTQAPDSFVSRTDFVVVPVIVTDSSGKHVTGLTKADFRLSENGREQKIAQFEEVTASGASLRTAPPVNGIYSNRVVSGEPATALAIVLMDQLNTRAVSQYWAVRGALNFLDKWKGDKGFPHPMMLAALSAPGLRIIHGPTMSPAVLAQAVELVRTKAQPRTEEVLNTTALPAQRHPDGTVGPIQMRPSRFDAEGDYRAQLEEAGYEAQVLDDLARAEEVVRRFDYEADERTTFWAIQGLANAVAGIPGRKVLIWIADTFPFAQSVQSSSPQWMVRTEPAEEESADVDRLRSETLVALNKANMSVYPVAAEGLLTPEYLGAGWGGRLGNVAYKRALQGDVKQMSDARFVADQTSGLECKNSNDIGDCLQHVIEDSNQHYLLAYYPDPKPKGEGWRRIKVDVQREHVNVRARREYYVGTQPGGAARAKEEVAIALKTKLLYTGLPVAIRLQPAQPSKDGKRTAQFVLAVEGRGLTIDEKHGNRVSLSVGIQAGQGAPTFQAIDSQLKAEMIEQVRSTRLTHNGTIDLTPGNYEVRVVVRDNLSGQMGSVAVPLKVD